MERSTSFIQLLEEVKKAQKSLEIAKQYVDTVKNAFRESKSYKDEIASRRTTSITNLVKELAFFWSCGTTRSWPLVEEMFQNNLTDVPRNHCEMRLDAFEYAPHNFIKWSWNGEQFVWCGINGGGGFFENLTTFDDFTELPSDEWFFPHEDSNYKAEIPPTRFKINTEYPESLEKSIKR